MYVDVLFAGAGLVSNLRQRWQLTSKSSETVRAELFYAVEAVEVIQSYNGMRESRAAVCVFLGQRETPMCPFVGVLPTFLYAGVCMEYFVFAIFGEY